MGLTSTFRLMVINDFWLNLTRWWIFVRFADDGQTCAYKTVESDLYVHARACQTCSWPFLRVSDRYCIVHIVAHLRSRHLTPGPRTSLFSRVSFDPTKRWQRAAGVLLPPKYAGKTEAGLTPLTTRNIHTCSLLSNIDHKTCYLLKFNSRYYAFRHPLIGRKEYFDRASLLL